MRSILWFQASGREFKPSALSFPFTKQHDSGAMKPLGKNAGAPHEYGFCEFRVPDDLPWDEKLARLLTTVESMASPVRSAGAESLEVRVLFYDGDSSTMDIPAQEMTRMGALGCDFIVDFAARKNA